MNKYALVKCINGNFAIHAESDDLNGMKVNFHGLCQTLWNAPDVLTAKVEIIDEQLNVVEGYREFIHHEPEETEAE